MRIVALVSSSTTGWTHVLRIGLDEPDDDGDYDDNDRRDEAKEGQEKEQEDQRLVVTKELQLNVLAKKQDKDDKDRKQKAKEACKSQESTPQVRPLPGHLPRGTVSVSLKTMCRLCAKTMLEKNDFSEVLSQTSKRSCARTSTTSSVSTQMMIPLKTLSAMRASAHSATAV